MVPNGLRNLMISEANIERKRAGTPSDSGFVDPSWAVLNSAPAPCRIQPYRGERIAEFERLGMKVTHRIHFSPPVDIKQGDRVCVLKADFQGYDYYAVKDAFNPDLMNWFTVVDAERIQS